MPRQAPAEPEGEAGPPESTRAEPRWPALLAVLAIGGLYLALPQSLSVGPGWLLLVIVVAVSVAAYITQHGERHTASRILGHFLSAIITAFMLVSIALLLHALFAHSESPAALLRAGAALWVTNLLVFASWYWRLDAGGPHRRSQRFRHTSGAFLFPQMTLGRDGDQPDHRPWSPRFIDYLFLAFTTSTAFSPTDTPVLSGWAKALMMLQASISLLVTVLLIARAVNII